MLSRYALSMMPDVRSKRNDMIEGIQPSEPKSQPPERQAMRLSSWQFAGISVVCSLTTYYLFMLYSYLHWTILARHYSDLQDPVKEKLFILLSKMELYRIFGLAAVIFALLALCRIPRWLAWFYIPLAGLAALASIGVM